MKRKIRTVTIRNTSRKVFRDRFDGIEYTIKPGDTLQVPEYIAKHWMGDWDLSGRFREEDVARARFRRGGEVPLELVKEEKANKAPEGTPSEDDPSEDGGK